VKYLLSRARAHSEIIDNYNSEISGERYVISLINKHIYFTIWFICIAGKICPSKGKTLRECHFVLKILNYSLLEL